LTLTLSGCQLHNAGCICLNILHIDTLYDDGRLWFHTSKLLYKLRDNKEGETIITPDGRLLLDEAVLDNSDFPKLLNEKVFVKMRDDRLTQVVKQDPLFVILGMSLSNQLVLKRTNDITQRLGQMARLCLGLSTELNIDRACYRMTISGHGFDLIIHTIDAEGEAFEDEHGRQLFRNPNVALKLGHSLIKLAKLKCGETVRTQDAHRVTTLQTKSNSLTFP
jgi:hypothetical protein